MQANNITQLLNAQVSCNKNVIARLVPLIYDELYHMAKNRLRGERSGHTLNATALVHEAYLKLIRFDRVNYQNSSHFFAIASQAMRNILVDYAMKQKSKKRGGKHNRVTLGEADVRGEMNVLEILSVHQALERLAGLDERQVRVVECRFFGGLTIEETAEALNISQPTVNRDWKMARAWLNRELAYVNKVHET